MSWPVAVRMLCRAWKPLVLYELAMSLISAAVLGPLVASCTYHVIGLSGEAVLGNFELFSFLMSPLGVMALVLFLSISFALLLLEYAGLIVLADAALAGTAVPTWTLVGCLSRSLPRLFLLALVQTLFALLAALPFLGLGALAYWFLLSDADINYFLAERPPRFWAAVAIAVVLGLGFGLVSLWFFARWALAVPICVLEKHSIAATLRASTRLMHGRIRNLLLAVGAWQLTKYIVFLFVVAVLDLSNVLALGRLEWGLTTLVWLTAIVLVVDTLILQLLAAVFAIVLASLLAYQYRQGRESIDEPGKLAWQNFRTNLATRPAWHGRAPLIALVCAGPLLSIGYALWLEREFIDHRPTLVTAHRAGPKAAPENGLSALALSIDAGADFAEIDVQQTADGHVILMHDSDLRRMTGDLRNVKDVTLADLADLRLRNNGAPTDDVVPTLSQFLEASAGHIRLNVEIKDYGSGASLVPAVLKELRAHDFTGQAIISSLKLAPLEQARREAPDVPVGIILSVSKGDLTRLPVGFLSLHHRLATASLVRRAHRRDMQVHVWTVSDRETVLRMLDHGCDNLITDNPALVREVVDWYANLGDVERMLLRMRRWMRE
ncbi:MAG TPA: glycerophosphodiester phosphodiesterase family protein [Pirellulales bacterium]